MKKIFAAGFLLLVLAAGILGLKLFVIGEPARSDTLAIDVHVHDRQADIHIQLTDSAMAISDIRYHYDGTALHLTVQKVLTSVLHDDGEKYLYYEITDETEIWINETLIWTAE